MEYIIFLLISLLALLVSFIRGDIVEIIISLVLVLVAMTLLGSDEKEEDPP